MELRMSRYRRLLAPLLWLTAIGVYILAVLPGGRGPQVFAWDKLNHAAAFLVLTLLATLAHPRASALRIAFALAAFGGFIELSQAIPAVHRDASFNDWFADIGAIAIGLLLTLPFRRAAEEAA
jgi:hypothetical protein